MTTSFIIHNVDRQAARGFGGTYPKWGLIRPSAFISSDRRVYGVLSSEHMGTGNN